MAGIQWLAKTSYYAIQKRFLLGIVNKNYNKMTKQIYAGMKEHAVYDLSGDGKCDSPGRNTKYLTYSFMDKITNKVFAFSLTQVTQSNHT